MCIRDRSKGIQTEVEYVDGMAFDRGYISPYFVTNPDRMEAVVEDPLILITDKKLSSVQEILPVLEKILQVSKNVVIICGDLEGEALATLAVNKLRGTINILAVKAPGFGDRQKDNLGDLATLTGATVISEEIGRTLDSVEVGDLGRARRVASTKEETTIIEGKGKKKELDARISQIRAILEDSKSDWDREKAQERLGKLAGSVAVIKVGAATETELKERKHRVEDAVASAKAAVEEGIVSGGGTALVQAATVFAGQMVRNAATVAGNIACGSPAADLVPPLLSLDAEVTLTSTRGSRTVALCDYYTGYKSDARAPDELITAISWPGPEANTFGTFYKLARRKGDAITVTGVAVSIGISDGRCVRARIALGSVAPIPMRARKAESLLEGQVLTPERIAAAAKAALPAGCTFHPRCPYFVPGQCDVAAPPLEPLVEGGRVACPVRKLEHISLLV